ncbi:MAG: DUF2283 domain-containing protein [Methanobrevibacter sp.]|nr:DUF2283 domain-containing protein [Methanobrevibacter sp.]
MNEKKLVFDFDYENDILFFYSEKDYGYEFSVFLSESIVMDFNKNKVPIGLEIFNASKLFKTKKHFLKTIYEGSLEILISKEKIKSNLTLSIKIHNKDTKTPQLNFVGVNDLQIPNINTELLVASL